MDPFKIVRFDVHGTEPLNKIVDEKMPIKDKLCPWLIPNGSPFFAEERIFKLYDQRGAEMKLGRDFFFEQEFIPFCDLSGRSICTFIRLSDAALAENEFVTSNYQTIGAWFVPRNNLEEWLEKIYNGKQPIPWSKVFGVPPTLPPEFHSHSIITEIGDWYELSYFFNYMANIYRTKDLTLFEDATRIINESFAALTLMKNTQLAKLNAHDANYSAPHQPTKGDLGLGNLDNFRTASPTDEAKGTSATLFSTPQGVQEFARTVVPNTDAAMRVGIMPISQFGNNSFIPPSITGSFEGMGQEVETSGICLEPSGLVMLLSNHMDGRTRGLYFSVVENYNKDDIRITYTNYKYNPPVLQALGIEVDRIVAGSGNKVIMTGKAGTNDWFIALTNDTFDPAAHSYVRCDVTALWGIGGNPYNGHETAMIHHMGDYLVLVQLFIVAGRPHHRFFRVKTEDVRLNKPVVWQAMKLSYQDWGGVQHNNMDDIEVMDYDYNASTNLYTRYGPWTPSRELNYVSIVRRALTLVAQKGNIKNTFYIHFLHYYFLGRVEETRSTTIGAMSDMQYEFNSETGVFTLISKPAPTTLELVVTNAEGIKYFPELVQNLVQYVSPSSVVLQTGEIASTHVIEGGGSFPVRFKVTKMMGVTSPETLLNKSLSNQFSTIERAVLTNPIVEPATLNGTFPSSLCYENDGELFEAIEGRTVVNGRYKRQLYTRIVSGDYQQREGVTNLIVGNVKSRPLTTAIYKANLLRTDNFTSVTGSAAELAAAGVECGALSLSTCGYTSVYSTPEQGFIPATPTLKAPAGHNTLLTFPRTHSKVINTVAKTSTYKGDTFYALRQNVVDKMKAYVPAASGTPSWCFTLTHLGEENGATFRGLNISVVMINWINTATGQYRGKLLLVRPVVEAPNADHPGVYLITDLTILDAPPDYPAFQNSFYSPSAQFIKQTEFMAKGGFSAYRDGNSLKVFHVGGYVGNTSNSGEIPFRVLFDLDFVANKINNIASSSLVSTLFSDVVAMIPKVGMSDVDIVPGIEGSMTFTPKLPYPHDYTGGGAAIFKKGSEYYMTMSVYPETGWVLFFQKNIKMMINGTEYLMEGGTVDLRDIDPDPRNKTFYVYATVEDNTPKYILSVARLRKRANLLPAATLTTNEKQILTIVRHQSFMVGDYLFSYTRDGGIIPVSSGFPQDAGNFAFLKESELLP